MPIVSISLNEEMLNQLEDLKKSLGFGGRSELIRTGIRAFIQEERQRVTLTGRKNALLTVVHADEYDDEVVTIKHDYEDLIKTHLHNKIDDVTCVEVFILDGDWERIEAVTNGFVTNKKMDAVKIIVLSGSPRNS